MFAVIMWELLHCTINGRDSKGSFFFTCFLSLASLHPFVFILKDNKSLFHRKKLLGGNAHSQELTEFICG